jgi:hypothetical protein
MSPSVFVEPFDLKSVYITYFLGNQLLFPFFFVMLLSYGSAYLGISNKIFLILLGLGSLMFGAVMGQAYYILALFMVGFVIYKIFGRILQ